MPFDSPPPNGQIPPSLLAMLSFAALHALTQPMGWALAVPVLILFTIRAAAATTFASVFTFLFLSTVFLAASHAGFPLFFV